MFLFYPVVKEIAQAVERVEKERETARKPSSLNTTTMAAIATGITVRWVGVVGGWVWQGGDF